VTHEAIALDTYRELQETAGAEFVDELVDTFLAEAPGMLAELRQAYAAGDRERFRRTAHSLKSNGLTFGATVLAARARALETQGFAGDGERDAAALDDLETAYAEAANALRELRRG
jgi:HPt (histidine-containing phosphotransfer) domain-containing protein